MRDDTVARNYGQALFELGQRTGDQTAYSRAFELVRRLFDSDPVVREFLNTPKITASEKKDVLITALRGRVPPLFVNFLLVVIDKRRQRLLPEIGDAYRAILDEHLGLLNVEVLLAHEPDERAELEITKQLSVLLGRKVVPQVRVDPAILGGIVVRYGDHLLDGSLRQRLLSLRARLLRTALPDTV